MKRALRVDKIRLAALEATLRLYRDPDRLVERVPTLRMLARPKQEIEALAQGLLPAVTEAIGAAFTATVIDCASQIGSGALPVETVPSAGIGIQPVGKRSGRQLASLSEAFRRLPIPVVGRIEDQTLILDLRCLPGGAGFVANLAALKLAESDNGLA